MRQKQNTATNLLKEFNKSIHGGVNYLNNSKVFAGVIMILLNVGSKFINIQFSRSTEEYLKMNVTKEILVFAMAWMGTRDCIAALMLTILFTLFSDHFFNEESHVCLVPHSYRVLHKQKTDKSGKITQEELAAAIGVLEKAKKNYHKNKEFIEPLDELENILPWNAN
jgi:hypothetical protein